MNLDRPLNMPAYSYHTTPPGSSVDLAEPVNEADAREQQQDDFDRLAITAATMLAGRTNLADKDLKDAAGAADRLIHFCRLHTFGPFTPPAAPTSLSLPAIAYLHQLVTSGPDAETRGNLHSGERRELLKAGLGAWVEDDAFACTDAGRALFAAGGVLVNEQDEAA